MKPKGGGDPTGPIAEAINKTFGSFKEFQTKFNDGVKQFGSGWVWLAGKSGGESRCSPRPTRTARSRKACSQSSATTSGSTPTT